MELISKSDRKVFFEKRDPPCGLFFFSFFYPPCGLRMEGGKLLNGPVAIWNGENAMGITFQLFFIYQVIIWSCFNLFTFRNLIIVMMIPIRKN